MALPDKKEKPKEKPTGWNFDPMEGLIILFLFVAIFSVIVPGIWNYFASGEFSFYGLKFSSFINFFKSNLQFFKALGFVVAGLAAIGTIVFNKKSDIILHEERVKLYPKNTEMSPSVSESVETPKNEKWGRIVKNSESENPSDWRLAIIEADIMLDELLDKLHLPGDTMGDKLKAVEKSDFTTIEYAWEAHKARNMIAHEGSNFLLNQHETRRIISLYEAVFKEFYLI